MKKKFVLSTILICLSCVFSFAEAPEGQRSDRKILEIKKIITLSNIQEKQIRKAYDRYNEKADYALYEVTDPYEAQLIKKEASKEFNETFIALLSESQKIAYEDVTSSSKKAQRSDRKMNEIKKIIDISEKQEKQIRQAYDVYNEKTDYALYQTTNPEEAHSLKKQAGKEFNETFLGLLTATQKSTYELVTGSSKEKSEKQRSDRKINEIKNVIEITAAQEKQIRKACEVYNEKVDYALENESDPSTVSQVKYDANKAFNETFMGVLTDNQRNNYFRVIHAPEIQAKTQAKVEFLKESGEYSSEQLEEMSKEIFEYLMAEKVVYARDKHNYKKQKENIGRLKQVQPKSLKESNTREKLHAQGKVKRGKVNW